METAGKARKDPLGITKIWVEKYDAKRFKSQSKK